MLSAGKSILIIAFFLAASGSAQAGVFATGAAVGGTSPDSITDGNGSIWVEYGNGADSTGASGSSTVVQYSQAGAIQQVYSIQGLADGLKFDPLTGMVWALQNNDGNATLSLIDPATHAVSAPLSYGPPYSYGPNGGSGRGYDDVAFLNGQVYLSYTNPVNPTDPVLQILNQGNNPAGSLTTTTILTAQQTGLTSSTNEPDIDSLKSTPNGKLVLTTEGDGPGCCDPVGEFTLISNPGTPGQTVTNVPVTNGGSNVSGIDDVIFPGATAGCLYFAETGDNTVDKLCLSGLNPNDAIVAIGGLSEIALVDPNTGDVISPLVTGLSSPHGMDFIPVPEPSSWAMMLAGLGALGAGLRLTRRAGKKRQLALPL